MKWSTVGLIEMSFWASILIICIIALRAVILSRLPKKTLTILWGVVVLRLLFPFSLTIEKAEGLAIINRTASKIFLSPSSAGAANIPAGIGPVQQDNAAMAKPLLTIAPHLLIWLCGMLAVMIIYLLIFIKQQGILRFSWQIKGNGNIDKWLAQNSGLLKFDIAYSDRIATPLTTGIIKPRVYLPRGMDINNEQLLDYVLYHEYCHIKHFDNFKKALLALVACVYWFNPLVWLMLVYASRDLEIRCDEMVLKHIGRQGRADYAFSLLSIADKNKGAAIFYSGYGKNSAEERIISIMKYKKATMLAVSAALVIVLGAVTVFATGSSRAAAAPGTEAEEKATGIRLLLDDVDSSIAGIDVRGVKHISSRPDFTFGFDCENVSKIEISSESSYLNVIDATNSLENIYSASGEDTISFADLTYGKNIVLDFGGDFKKYAEVTCNWFNYDLYQWATQNGSWKIRGIGGELGNVDIPEGISEEEQFLLAAGDDGMGTTGVGHVQTEGYPAGLLKDTLEVRFTYNDGTVETRYMSVDVANDGFSRLNIDVRIRE